MVRGGYSHRMWVCRFCTGHARGMAADNDARSLTPGGRHNCNTTPGDVPVAGSAVRLHLSDAKSDSTSHAQPGQNTRLRIS